MVHGCVVHTEHAAHVAPAMPALLVHHFGGYSKTRYKKLFTHVESHASAVNARERRIALYKSDQQQHAELSLICF